MWRGLAIWTEKLIFLVRLFVLARLLAPEDFGLVAIGMTAMAVMAEVTNLGLVPALVQQPADQKRYLDTAWTISATRGLAITVILLVIAPAIAELFAEPRATNIIRALALVMLAHAVSSIGIAAVTRSLDFRNLALIQLAGAVINTVISILLAARFGAWSLVWGSVAGAAAYMIGSYVVAPYRPALRFSRTAANRLMRFGRWVFMIGVLGVLGDAALRWLISQRLGVAELGLFFLAARLAFLPAQAITDLSSDVAFPVYARLSHDPGKLARAFRTMLTSVQALLIPASLIFVVLIPGIVEHLLGDRWFGTTRIMQFLVLSALVGGLGDCVLPLLKGIGRPNLILALDVFRLAMLLPLGWVAIDVFGLAGIGIAYVASSLISQLPVIYVLSRAIDKPFAGVAAPFIAIMVTGAAGAMAAFGVAATMPGIAGLVAATVAAGAAALLVGLCLDRVFDLRLLQMVAEPFPRLGSVVGQIIRWRKNGSR